MADNGALTRRWFDEVWNKQNTAVIREMMTDDTVHHGLTGLGGPPLQGFEAFEKFHAELLEALPDLHIELEDVVVDGEKVGARYTATGTQQGPLPDMPATGKKVRFTGGGICVFKHGKFAEVWNEVDFQKMQYDLAPDTPDVQ